MLREAIDSIVKLAQASKEPTLATHAGVPHKVLYTKADGSSEWIDSPPEPRKHAVFGLEDFATMIVDEKDAPAPIVFVGPNGVIALLDKETRRESVTLRLFYTERFQMLQSLTAQRPMTPKEAIRFLRTRLHTVGGEAERLMASLSNVDFERKGTGRSSVEHGRESLGKDVEMIVQQRDKIPQEIVVTVPVFCTSGLENVSASLTLDVYLDMEEQKVVLSVPADEIGTAIDRAYGRVCELVKVELKDAGNIREIAVVRGAPCPTAPAGACSSCGSRSGHYQPDRGPTNERTVQGDRGRGCRRRRADRVQPGRRPTDAAARLVQGDHDGDARRGRRRRGAEGVQGAPGEDRGQAQGAEG